MDISLNGSCLSVRTPFSPAYDLIQVFSGIRAGALEQNGPVDFQAAGLQRKGHRDIWHMDVVLAYSTDETAPLLINGEDIGGNHGCHCGVRVCAPDHDKTFADIGSLWNDDDGLAWTLVRIEDAQNLLFVSENIGPSEVEYQFANMVKGVLRHISDAVHTSSVVPASQKGHLQVARSNRYQKKEVYCWKNGIRRLLSGSEENCDKVEIVEEYEVINPATMSEALRRNRPSAGYSTAADLAVGTPMFLYRTVFRIEKDGTVLIDFDHQTLQGICWHGYLALMYQEKCDVFGAGLWRYIPKMYPVPDKEGKEMDFSVPLNTSQVQLPAEYHVTAKDWRQPDSPPDRQIDFIRLPGGSSFTEGDSLAAFAGGFLPVYDGQPAIRKRQIAEATTIVDSRKAYPTFLGGESHFEAAKYKGYTKARGVAYRKYFSPSHRQYSQYTVNFRGSTYLYLDFWGPEKNAVRYEQGGHCSVELVEADGDLQWNISSNELTVQGIKGYAVFLLKESGI